MKLYYTLIEIGRTKESFAFTTSNVSEEIMVEQILRQNAHEIVQ